MDVKKINLKNQEFILKINSKNKDIFLIELENKQFNVKLINTNKELIFFEINGSIYKAKLLEKKQNYLYVYIFNFKKTFKLEMQNSSQIIPAKASTAGQKIESSLNTLISPISGKILKINVQENDFVYKNQTLLIIESMKMENEIRAQYDAFIKTIQISSQDLVQQNQILITFEKRGECYAKTKIPNEHKEI